MQASISLSEAQVSELRSQPRESHVQVRLSIHLTQQDSISNKSIADEPSPRSPSATDLLVSLGAEAPSRKTKPNLYTNPIRTSAPQTSSPPYPSPSTSSPNGHKASAGVLRLLDRANARAQNPQNPQSTTLEDMQKYKLSADLSKQISRRWKAGDVYAPHDLSAVEMGKWKSRGRPTHDVFDVLDFNPLEHYRVSRHLTIRSG